MFNFQRFRGSLSLIFLAALISTPILWLISYPMNYFFYLVSTLLIFFFTENFSSSYKVKVSYVGDTTLIEFMPLTVVCVLLLLNLAGIYHTTINIVLSAVIVFFMPGYVIMWLFDRSSNSVFLKLSMSFALSFVVNGFIYTFTSIFTETVFERRMVILLVYLFYFSGAYLIKRFICHIRLEGSRNNVTCRLADVLLLAIYIIIFIYAILNMYPKTAFNPGLDIVQHFSSAWVAAINPSLLKSAYPWFHFEEAMVIILSAPSQEVNVFSSYMPVYQAVLAFLGVLPMASFYVMARAYLKDVDERLPVIATGFWMFFSGFGWLNLLGQIDYSTFSRLKVLGIVEDKSFWDIGYGGGQSIWFWYRPLTVGFTLLFIIIYLLRKEGMSKRMFMSLSIMLIVGLVFAHFSELVVFVGILSFLSIISPRILPRLHDMLLATTLGTILALLSSIVLRCWGIVFSIDYNYLIIVTLLTLLCYFLTFKWKGFHFRYSGVLVKLLSLFLLIFYASALFEWLSSMDFSVWRVSSTQFVPWLLYPVILGVIGLLAIISLSQYQQYFNKPICLFVYMFIFMIAFGKVVSFVNNSYFDTGYWERRLIVHCFAAASALAPIPLLKAYNKLILTRNKFLATMIIGLIVVSGMSSTFLSVEYRSSLTEQSPLSNVEMNVASFLFEALKENSMGSPIFTISDRSRGVAEFTGSYYVVGTGGRISFSEAYPERPLLNLYNWSPTPYILITNSDKPLLSSKYGGYVSSHLLRFIPKVYDDGYSEIYSLPNGTPPSLESKTILVLPGDETNTNYFFAYDVLSLSRYDYTTMLMNDPNIYKGDVIILPYDPQGASDIDQLLRSLGDKDIIVINTNGYGAIADSLFTGSFRYTLKTNSTNTSIILENENFKRTSVSANTINASAIKGVYDIELPLNVLVEPILPKNPSNVISFYKCEQNISIPLAVRGQYNGHEITYVNVYPLISAIQSDEGAGRKLFPVLGYLLNASRINLPKYSENTSWLYEFTVAFRSSSLDGNITLSSSSVILEGDVTAIGYKDENIREEFENILSISLVGEGNLKVFAHKVEMLPERGFYSNVAVKDRQLTITGSNITAYIKLNNGSLTVIGGLKELFIYSNNTLSAYLREPEIRVAGHATFKDFQPYNKPSFNRLRNSMTANITGTVSFILPISDVYSWARSFTYNGDVEYDKPLVYWDEWDHMRALLPWVIVCIILLIASSLLVSRFEISKKKIEVE